MLKTCPAFLITACLAFSAATARADHFNAAYIKGADGVWEHDGYWTTGAYPNNGHTIQFPDGSPEPGPNPDYDVLISVPTPCTLGIGVAIQTLNVTKGATLNLRNNASINANTGFGSAGLVTLNSTGGGSHLRVGHALNGETSGLVAPGLLLMSDNGSNYLSGTADGVTFTVGKGATIRGAGQLNLGYFGGDEHLLNYVNHGLIEATRPVNALQIGLGEPVGSRLRNDGILRARSHGLLRIHSFNTAGNVDNTGGTINVIEHGVFRLAPPVVLTGGTLTTSGSGAIHGDGPGAGGGVFKDVTNSGLVAIDNSEELTFAGTFTNKGAVELRSTGSGATLRFANGATLAGPGAVTLSNNGSNYIMAADGSGDAFTIAQDGTIRGSGQISPGFSGGGNMSKITNRGLIDANFAGGSLSIRVENSNDTDFINAGTLRASNGASLLLGGGGTFLNDGGTIAALNASAVRLAPPAVISGGTITSSGTGAIHGAGPGGGGGTLLNVTNTGTVQVDNSEELTVAGTFNNNGSVRLNSTGSGAILRFANGATLAGAGVVTLSNDGTNYIMAADSGGDEWTIAQGATLQGAGNINPGFSGGSNMSKITNRGLIDANISNAALAIRAENFTTTPFTNSGTLRASNGGTLAFHGTSTLTNTGTITAAAGSHITDEGGISILQTAGMIDLDDGDMTFPAGVDLNGGELKGNGTFNGPIRNNGGAVGPGHSPGAITINGSYTQAANGVLNIEIGGNTPGSGYDQLVVNGAATLGGTLNVSLINGYRPAIGDVFTILAPQSVTGAFAKINASGLGVQANYASGAITLTVTSVPDLLLNISSRLGVLSDSKALFGGFIITGTQPKKVIIRALGPSLNVPGALQNPTLDLFDANGPIVSNDDWKQTQQAAIEATGIAPTNDSEAAIVRTLNPGLYTAIVRGKDNTSGVGLVEVYDLDQHAASKLANISSRGFVDTNNPLIGGFIAGGLSGGTTTKVVVRALGPSLRDLGIADALNDPTLQLIDANGSIVRANDNWPASQAAALTALKLQPKKDAESALIATLPAGAYTAVVREKKSQPGVGVVEIYSID